MDEEILDRFKMKDYTRLECLKLHKDEEGEKVDIMMYKQMIGSLMYLTAIRPNIMYAVSLRSRYVKNPTTMQLACCQDIFTTWKELRILGCPIKKMKN